MKIVSLCEHPEYIEQVAEWTWRAFCKEDRPSVTIDAVRKKLQAQKIGVLPHTYIALCGGRAVGTVAMYDNDLKGEAVTPWLGSLFVPEEMRGRGIARALISHVRSVAQSAGFDTLYLRTEHTAAYYEALGWEFVKETVDPVYQLQTRVYRTKLSGFRAEKVPEDRWDCVRLFDDAAGTSATIAVGRGGILTQFYAAGQEVMYLNEETLHDITKSVRGGCPILFPSCGRLIDKQYTYHNQVYHMNIHGVARNHLWKIVETSTADAAKLTIVLESNDATRREYPFDFKVFYTYCLRGDRMSITQRFVNCSQEAMPFSSGLHPYFRIDPPSASVTLASGRYLSVAEDCKPYDYDGTTGFAGAVEYIARDLRDLGAELDTGLGHRVHIDAEGDYRYYVVWSPEDVQFGCVEPWTALPNALNTQEDLIWLKPGEEKELNVSFSVSKS